jgi:hypothetical protein
MSRWGYGLAFGSLFGYATYGYVGLDPPIHSIPVGMFTCSNAANAPLWNGAPPNGRSQRLGPDAGNSHVRF